jgi:hypothetical protein
MPCSLVATDANRNGVRHLSHDVSPDSRAGKRCLGRHPTTGRRRGPDVLLTTIKRWWSVDVGSLGDSIRRPHAFERRTGGVRQDRIWRHGVPRQGRTHVRSTERVMFERDRRRDPAWSTLARHERPGRCDRDRAPDRGVAVVGTDRNRRHDRDGRLLHRVDVPTGESSPSSDLIGGRYIGGH